MKASKSNSPHRSTLHPALVRSVKDGAWKLNPSFDSDAAKLSPGKGGELRDLQHLKVPALGPDPKCKLLPKVHIAERHKQLMVTTSSSSSSALLGCSFFAAGSSTSSSSLSPSHGRRAVPIDASPPISPSKKNKLSGGNNSSPDAAHHQHHSSPKSPSSASSPSHQNKSLLSIGAGGGSPRRQSNVHSIPLDAESTAKNISQFEDRLLRLDLRKPDDRDNAPTRPDTPVDEKALLFRGSASGIMMMMNNAAAAAASSNAGAAGSNSLKGAASPLSSARGGAAGANTSHNQQQQQQQPFSLGSESAAMVSVFATKNDPSAGITFHHANDPNAPSRPWETLDPTVRAQNPIFGILCSVQPSQLRRAFQQVVREFPRARAKGLASTDAFPRLLSLLAPQVELSEHLVLRAMSYFDIVSLVDSSNDSQFLYSGNLHVRAVTFPQILIRFAADSAPRYTDVAVVAVFACIAGTPASKLQSNSAIYVTSIKSAPIRQFCATSLHGDNSIALNRWLAVADALDDKATMEEIQELIADVVYIPPKLQRSELELRIFGKDQMPNGTPVQPPPLITLDCWRYVAYASAKLLPLCVDLRLSVENPHLDNVRAFEFKSY